MWPAYTFVPPRRTPRAPAAAASGRPAFGLGCRPPSRRNTRQAAAASPPTSGAASTVSAPVTRAGSQLAASSSRAATRAEAQVPRRAVPDHRVERVDGAVAEQARHARDSAPEQRRHDGVGGVLGERLDGRPGERARVEPTRVPCAQVPEPARARLRGHRARARAAIRSPSRARDVPPSTTQVAAAVMATAASRASAGRRARPPTPSSSGPASDAATRAAPGCDGVRVEPPLQPGDQLPEPRDGVQS